MRTGLTGWATLVAYVWFWDRYAPETLSSAFGRAAHHRVGKPLVVAVWSVTTAHLFGLIGQKYDPFARLFYGRRV